MVESCIYCGTCVNICPSGAKQVRNDVRKVKQLLRTADNVIVSVAPSWVSEFPDLDAPVLVNALKQLGFSGVSETALGAQEVSAHVAELLEENTGMCLISSACPVVVEYIRKYHCRHVDKLTGLESPVMAHAGLLKRQYGGDTCVVFIGPCIAKKLEADASGGMLSAALTFEDLRIWLETEDLLPESSRVIPGPDDVFIPCAAEEGALYPIDGGMIASINSRCPVHDSRCMSVSGLDNIADVLEGLDTLEPGEGGLFLELLACRGGCINGPKSNVRTRTLSKRLDIIKNAGIPESNIPRTPVIEIDRTFVPESVEHREFSEDQVRAVLRQTGKLSVQDELNCGGCGYNSCREFSLAVLEGKAETSMCVSYMRQLAHKKANKLIESMPSAVVIVDSDLRIIECNLNFVRLAGPEAEEIYEVNEGLGGAVLEKVLPVSHLFRQVLQHGQDISKKELHIKGQVLQCSLFTIEEGNIVGGILNDVTEPVMKKDEITRKAKQVIRKNLKTVQKIAYLLGENASETEMTLDSIIDAFNAKEEE
jgi:ferredoxin